MRRAVASIFFLASCAPAAPPRREPSPPPIAAASAVPSAAPEDEPPARPAVVSRRGTCQLDRAIADYLLGQDAVQCGDVGRRPTPEQNAKARACILGALREGRPFVASYGGTYIDAALRGAIVGRDDGDRLEVRWFYYDSCPSGCGDEDPHWWSLRCAELADLEVECKKVHAARKRAKLARKKKQQRPEDDELRDLCPDEEDDERDQSIAHTWASHNRFGLWCKAPTDERSCGASLP